MRHIHLNTNYAHDVGISDTTWSCQLDADVVGQEHPLSYQPKADVNYVYFAHKQKHKQCTLLFDTTGMLSDLRRTINVSLFLIWGINI